MKHYIYLSFFLIFITLSTLNVCLAELRIYEIGCDHNSGIHCSMLGSSYEHGIEVKQDYEKAKAYYEKACDLNDDLGCSGLGRLYEAGIGVKHDYAKAKTYYEKACDRPYGQATGCTMLGTLYYFGTGVKQDYEKAKTYYEKACETDEGTACGYLGEFYKYGYGVGQDVAKAITYYERGCDLNDHSRGIGCISLGILYLNGVGVEQDYEKAKVYFEKACDTNEAVGGPGCTNLGRLYMNHSGLKQDYEKAKAYYEKACDLNEGTACTYIGDLYESGNGVEQDYEKAKAYYKKACDLNDDYACSALGELYESGNGVEQDNEKANTYYKKACDLNPGGGLDLIACHNLSKLESKSEEYISDHDRPFGNTVFYVLYGLACELGISDACDHLEQASVDDVSDVFLVIFYFVVFYILLYFIMGFFKTNKFKVKNESKSEIITMLEGHVGKPLSIEEMFFAVKDSSFWLQYLTGPLFCLFFVRRIIVGIGKDRLSLITLGNYMEVRGIEEVSYAMVDSCDYKKELMGGSITLNYKNFEGELKKLKLLAKIQNKNSPQLALTEEKLKLLQSSIS